MEKLKSPKLKIFQLTLKNLATVGISPNLATQPYPLNGKIYLGILILGSGAICNVIYIFQEAKTFSEYSISIYMCSFTILIIFILTILILNVEKLCNLFDDDFENIVNTSEQMSKIFILNPKNNSYILQQKKHKLFQH